MALWALFIRISKIKVSGSCDRENFYVHCMNKDEPGRMIGWEGLRKGWENKMEPMKCPNARKLI